MQRERGREGEYGSKPICNWRKKELKALLIVDSYLSPDFRTERCDVLVTKSRFHRCCKGHNNRLNHIPLTLV